MLPRRRWPYWVRAHGRTRLIEFLVCRSGISVRVTTTWRSACPASHRPGLHRPGPYPGVWLTASLVIRRPLARFPVLNGRWPDQSRVRPGRPGSVRFTRCIGSYLPWRNPMAIYVTVVLRVIHYR